MIAPAQARRRRSRERLAALLLVLSFPVGANAQEAATAPPPVERTCAVNVRAGAGVDSNVLHDPRADHQTALLRVDLTVDLEPARDLKLSLVGWFDQHLPLYDLNEAAAELLLMFRRPIYKQLYFKLGSFGEYRRELSTFFEGTVYTKGAFLLSDAAEHLSLGLEQRFGVLDIDVGVTGNVKDVRGTQAFDVFGVDGHIAFRLVPNRFVAIRLRYLFLFEDVRGLELFNLQGAPSGVTRDLALLTHQADLSMHVRPIEPLHLFLRYEFAAVDDDFVGYLYGQEHRLVGGLRFESEKRWVVDLSAKMVYRNYPLRDPAADNQNTDLPFEAIADVELKLHKHWALFVRYQFDGEAANPFGLIYLRHAAIAGVAARARGSW